LPAAPVAPKKEAPAPVQQPAPKEAPLSAAPVAQKKEAPTPAPAPKSKPKSKPKKVKEEPTMDDDGFTTVGRKK
jgi:hypothetical protein